MKIAFHSAYREHNTNDSLFRESNADIGDDLLLPFVTLKNLITPLGIQVGTTDVLSVEEADAVVFIDMPSSPNSVLTEALFKKKRLFLIALESPAVNPESHNVEFHKIFHKVFTWNDDLISIDASKYVKINYSFLPQTIDPSFLESKNKLCCLISGNKTNGSKNELYSERLNAIRWFEKEHITDFDLYGIGWNRLAVGDNRIINAIFRRAGVISKMLSERRKSYKGSVLRKSEVLKAYKFSICYENVYGFNGYITEKIFDSFFSGCVPIYLGAPNIQEYIPRECYIDKREFPSYKQLYNYIAEMPEYEYFGYIESIRNFIESKHFEELFSCNAFSNTIAKHIV